MTNPDELSAYMIFSRSDWAALRASTSLTLSEADLAALRGLNGPITTAEVSDVYLPLTRLLNLHFSAARNLMQVKAEFLGRPARRSPYIIALAGSVGVGKSTFARVLCALLAGWADHPRVELVTTDGFLHANAVLEERGLMRRKGKFDAIIVETTGLADPAPVAQTFFVDEDVQKNARLDAVVTVADAKWLSDRLKDAPEAKNQIAFADVIVLNKTDLVSKPELAEVEARIRGINPYAKLHRTERCQVGLTDVLERGAFDLDRILEIEPDFLEAGDDHDHDHHHHDHGHHHDHDHHHHDHGHGLKHYHDEDMQSLSLRSEKPLDPTKFMPWLQNLVATEGQKILRSKGILAFTGDDDRYVFQGVHMMLEGDHQRKWKDGEKRESRVVFIGRELPEQAIRDGFEQCITT